MNKLKLIGFMVVLVFLCFCKSKQVENIEIKDAESLNNAILNGWNTWDNRSISTQVLLPEGLAFNIQINDTLSGDSLHYIFPGNRVAGAEKVKTIAHTPTGSFTDFIVFWRKFGIRIQTVSKGKDINVLVQPLDTCQNPGRLQVSVFMLYDKKGDIQKVPNKISSIIKGKTIELNSLNTDLDKSSKPIFEFSLKQKIAFTTIKNNKLKDVETSIFKAQKEYNTMLASKGKQSESYDVIQNALNWSVVYDPAKNRAVTPVARTWSFGWGNGKEGGYVLFCWDNLFAALMHSLESKELAFNEAIQMCNEIDELEFVPNYSAVNEIKSRDRSQPPVGSMIVLEIYKKYPEKWFLQKVFPQLLTWNRWWMKKRHYKNYLCWGSNPVSSPTQDARELTQNNFEAASNESGLDNTPMYDGIEFDKQNHIIPIADVGLMSLYTGDCDALAEIAGILGENNIQKELTARANDFRQKLQTLWDEKLGMFLNKNLITNELSYRISPTNFYALIAKAANQKQAERMIQEHFYNPKEFWGEYIMPSIARNDTAYTGKDYWRGSIWAPMNFLVYLGFRNYDLLKARQDLSIKSSELLLKEWRKYCYVRENYHAETGTFPGSRSDHYYHWGALLGMIAIMEGNEK